jgi:hypothetical protein
MKQSEVEKIAYVAIKVKQSSDRIYKGTSHGQIMQLIWAYFPKLDLHDSPQGYLTNTGRFVTRSEAAEIAF